MKDKRDSAIAVGVNETINAVCFRSTDVRMKDFESEIELIGINCSIVIRIDGVECIQRLNLLLLSEPQVSSEIPPSLPILLLWL